MTYASIAGSPVPFLVLRVAPAGLFTPAGPCTPAGLFTPAAGVRVLRRTVLIGRSSFLVSRRRILGVPERDDVVEIGHGDEDEAGNLRETGELHET